MERRDEFQITAFNSTDDWHVLFVEMPVLSASIIVLKWKATSTQPSRADLENALKHMMQINGTSTPQYPSVSTFTYTVDFIGQILTCSAISNGTYGSASQLETLARTVRRTYCGCTYGLDASTLYNQGRVIAGQWSPDVVRQAEMTIDSTPVEVNVYEMQLPAMVTANIVQSDSLCYQQEAKNGVYTVNRMCESAIINTPAVDLARFYGKTPGVAFGGLVADTNYDVWLKGWCVGVVLFLNLNSNAQIRIKRKEGLEFIPAPNSTLSPFATPGLPEDSRALSMIREFGRTEPHGYPADYNESDNMLPHIIGTIGNAVANLGIPVISDIGKAVSGLSSGDISGLASLLGSIL
jgi:hypothetical protein